jgi:NAD(P)-dependent dehydrogenase (short-subunit alcohol dehydrogenase family)
MNKIALVTGSSRGLGKNMALAFARKGVDVIVTYRTGEQEAKRVSDEIKERGVKSAVLPFDASDIKNLQTFVRSLQDVLQSEWQTNTFDYLVNNAGIGATIPFEEATEEQFDQFLNIHFKSVYFLTQKCVPLLRENGCIINISSGTTRFSVPGYSLYTSMKGAIEIFTKFLAKELGPKGIRANVVAPGPIETDFNNAAIRNNPQQQAFLKSQTPLGRIGRADDIGSVVAFLCSEEAKWINGQRIEVSGGINL